MAIPDFQSLMLPVLLQSAQGEVKISDVVESLATDMKLTPEEAAELIPSGKQTTFRNRVHWAKSYLKQAGLVEATRRAHFRISDRGRAVLAAKPERIDIKFLGDFPEFVEFQKRENSSSTATSNEEDLEKKIENSIETPDDLIRSAHGRLNFALGKDILDRILVAPPSFFERLIVNLLLAMDYGGSAIEAGRAIGRSGDDGIDGVVDQDPLGLDRVYIQAKRYAPTAGIGAGAIRDFFGSLDMHKAGKGIFFTTSFFTISAKDTAEKLGKRIVLIDGKLLTELMIRYNVGCRIEEAIEIKRIDEEFFE
jgi:restriction system protein